jgi:hypothetical protein
MNRMTFAMLLAAGCTTAPPASTDITGPFTGTARRYVVDRIDVPLNGAQAREMAADLDGDHHPDNQLGAVIPSLLTGDNLTTHGPDMIASGSIASSVIITADDLVDDPTVSVLYLGADGDPSTAVGGLLRDGAFVSNRTATTIVPGAAVVRLPVFADAEPSVLPVDHLEMELRPDGVGGFDAYLRGSVSPDQAVAVAYKGLSQLVAANPGGHRTILGLFDTSPMDWTISEQEFAQNDLIESLFETDITLAEQPVLSFAIAVHLIPCESGRCSSTSPEDTCFDRVRDGDESDIDCGGSCRSCRTDESCATPNDCDSLTCDAGVCAAPRCDDGVRDGLETDVDCGGSCTHCELDEVCYNASDCDSVWCYRGSCKAPSCSDGIRNGLETRVDCGGPCAPCAP